MIISDLLKASIASRLDARNLEILEVKRNTVGMSADIFFLRLHYSDIEGEKTEEIVIRRQPTGGIMESYDYASEYQLLDVLGRSGIPVPRVLWYEADRTVFGMPFYVMKKCEGTVQALDPRVALPNVFDPEERAGIADDFVDYLVKIHQVDWPAAGLGFMNTIPEGGNYVLRQLEQMEDGIRRLGFRDNPQISLIFNMMKDNIPPPAPLRIIHGDYRTGNFLTRNGRIEAILDWELCHLGDPHEDLAYVMSPVWRSAGDGLVNHLLTDEAFIGKYEALSGWKVDPFRLMYFGLLNGIRSLTMMAACANAFSSSREPDMRDGVHCMMVDFIAAMIVPELGKLKGWQP